MKLSLFYKGFIQENVDFWTYAIGVSWKLK